MNYFSNKFQIKYKMKKSLLLIFLVIISVFSYSQTWVDLMLEDGKFNEAQIKFEQSWKNKPIERGKGFKQFKRWEDFTKHRLDENGRMNTLELWNAYLKINAEKNQKTDITANWRLVGPNFTPVGGGNGRLNCIAFHPTDTNTFYVGAPVGGIWKTTNGGLTWSTSTDFLSCIGISDIIINPLNPNIMYMGTGDKDAGDSYSIGVMKSYDAGDTWIPTTLSFESQLARKVNRLLIHPIDTATILVATSYGIYKTTDGGTTWVRKKLGNYKDMVFKPGNPNIIYAATSGSIHRSINGGETFQILEFPMLNFTPSRITLAVTPSDSNYLYAIIGNSSDQGFGTIVISTDGGNSFTTKQQSNNLLGWSTDGDDTGGQAWYDLALAAHPFQKNIIFSGGVNIWRSVNSAGTFTLNAHWYGGAGKPYVHADIHELKFAPNSNRLYACTDGGLFVTTNNGQTWTDISSNLVIAQIYRLDHSTQNANLILTGWQDNGTNLGTDDNWQEVLGGDGMDCAIDYENDQIMYGSYYYGAFYRSDDGGFSWEEITNNIPEEGAWVTPIALHPTQPSNVYIGLKNVYKSIDYGVNWLRISDFQSETNINRLKIAPSNPNVIYVGYDLSFIRTTNGGDEWENFFNSIGVNVTDITIHPNNENEVWITMSGYNAQNKVYHTRDGGLNWINITENLPNIPVNCIVYENNSPNGIYIGTDVGVYYHDTIINSWVQFSNGLPNTVVRDMEIHYNTGKLRAATYGRAVWETELYSIVGINDNHLKYNNTQLTVFPNPAKSMVNLSINNDQMSEGMVKVFDVNGRCVLTQFVVMNNQMANINISRLTDGFYLISYETKNGTINQKLVIRKD